MTRPPLDRAERACAELAQAGQPVTFTAVAARVTVLGHPLPQPADPRHHRRAPGPPSRRRTLSGLVAEISHLRTALEAVAGNVRQNEERLRRLERQGSQKPQPEAC